MPAGKRVRLSGENRTEIGRYGFADYSVTKDNGKTVEGGRCSRRRNNHKVGRRLSDLVCGPFPLHRLGGLPKAR